MRALLLCLLVCAPAGAQTFRLVDPALTVDNRRVGVAGAPLVQEPFGMLVLSVPGAGVFRISAAPFDGAAAAGEFDGDGLFFAVDGTSVRLRSSGPILEERASAPAFVRFDALSGGTPRTRATGLARVSVSDTPGGTPRSSADIAGRAEAPRGPAALSRPATDARAEAERDRLHAQRTAQSGWPVGTGGLAQATARSEALAAEADRLRAERDQIAAARDRAEADRTRLAGQFDATRSRVDAALSTPAQAEAAGNLDRLRADVVARDQTLAALRTESEDRRIRLAETDAALGQARRALAAMTAERDVLRLQITALQSDRDRFAGDASRLTSDLVAERATSAALRVGTPAPAAALPSRSGVPVASFPDLDFSRLINPDAVRRRVDEAEYPRWAAEGRITGDVLVLFSTDASGRVVRTAVATPIGGGLDGLAESLVRDMQFVSPIVGGIPTGMRSQVLVRFAL